MDRGNCDKTGDGLNLRDVLNRHHVASSDSQPPSQTGLNLPFANPFNMQVAQSAIQTVPPRGDQLDIRKLVQPVNAINTAPITGPAFPKTINAALAHLPAAVHGDQIKTPAPVMSAECTAPFEDEWIKTLTVCEQSTDPLISTQTSISCKGPRPYVCIGEHISLHPDQISVAKGNENIEDVLGRPESVEFPKYNAGALQGSCKLFLGDSVLKNVFKNPLMETLLLSLQEASPNPACDTDTWDSTPTVMLTRLDYADLLHTFAELFHTYIGLRYMGVIDATSTAPLIRSSVRMLLFDGHAQSLVDDLWTLLFDENTRHVSTLPSAPICMKQVLIVPSGPGCALFDQAGDCPVGRAQPLMEDFMAYTATAFGVVLPVMEPTRVVFLQQYPHRLHPRQEVPDKAPGQIENMDDILFLLRRERPDLRFQVVTVGRDSLKQLFVATRSARVVVALHSAPTAMWVAPGATLAVVTHPRNRESVYRLASNINYHALVYSPTWIGTSAAAASLPPNYVLAIIDAVLTPAFRSPATIPPDMQPEVQGLKQNERGSTSRRTVVAPHNPVYMMSGRFSPSGPTKGSQSCFTTHWAMSFDVCVAPANTEVQSRIACRRQMTTDSTYCEASNFLVSPDLINLSKGGEEIEAVLGRQEHLELPRYAPSALAAACNLFPDSFRRIAMFAGNYLTSVIRNITADFDGVENVCRTPTFGDKIGIFITREEYANLFHTMRDLFNTYHVLRMIGLLTENSTAEELKPLIQVVWLDGHAKGSLDSVWADLFGPPLYVKQLSGSTCFKRAVFVHPGPRSVLHQQQAACGMGQGNALIGQFANYVRQALGLKDVQATPGLITLIGRQKYIAHPRVNVALLRGNSTASRLIVNENALIQAVRAQRPDLNIRLVYLTPGVLSFREQLRHVIESQVVVAFHGAALAHIVFAKKPTSFLELSVPRYRARNNFALIARNMYADYMMHTFPRTAEKGSVKSDLFEIPIDEFLKVLAAHAPPPTTTPPRA